MNSLERHEFVDGNLFVMAGGTDKQNHICGELYILLKPVAQAAGFRTYMSDVLIRTPNNIGYYPDVFISADNLNDSSRVKREPIIIEVLGDSTEMFDRSEKATMPEGAFYGQEWLNYQTIPSLDQYVLISQSTTFAEMYSRNTDGSWRYQSFSGDATLHFSSIDFNLQLGTLYIDLPNEN